MIAIRAYLCVISAWPIIAQLVIGAICGVIAALLGEVVLSIWHTHDTPNFYKDELGLARIAEINQEVMERRWRFWWPICFVLAAGFVTCILQINLAFCSLGG